jgi:hypothetical protein
MDWPQVLQVNAWDGVKRETPGATLDSNSRPWALQGRTSFDQFLLPEPEVDLKNWRDPRVDWGLILPENPALWPPIFYQAAMRQSRSGGCLRLATTPPFFDTGPILPTHATSF